MSVAILCQTTIEYIHSIFSQADMHNLLYYTKLTSTEWPADWKQKGGLLHSAIYAAKYRSISGLRERSSL